MRHDPDFAEPIVIKPHASPTALGWAWGGVCLINMIVPAFFGWQVTEGFGVVGMMLGAAAVLGLGLRAVFDPYFREAVRTVVYGGCIVAMAQFVPVGQFLAGRAGIALAWKLGLVRHAPLVGRIVDTLLGGFLATFVTAVLLIAVAGGLGLLGRAIAAVYEVYCIEGGVRKTAVVSTPKEA